MSQAAGNESAPLGMRWGMTTKEFKDLFPGQLTAKATEDLDISIIERPFAGRPAKLYIDFKEDRLQKVAIRFADVRGREQFDELRSALSRKYGPGIPLPFGARWPNGPKRVDHGWISGRTSIFLHCSGACEPEAPVHLTYGDYSTATPDARVTDGILPAGILDARQEQRIKEDKDL
ncbi:hypothetical protein [Archangium violaceum]|uniref:hypothetical protein n=1 Tax=Archangium violaceum TaxID=83451 RepID=UPI00126A56C4|nr:hypothetical protein [Archangium violaceum]